MVIMERSQLSQGGSHSEEKDDKERGKELIGIRGIMGTGVVTLVLCRFLFMAILLGSFLTDISLSNVFCEDIT
jgi:uncharacterized protein YqhQ